MSAEQIKNQIEKLGFKVHTFIPLEDGVKFEAYNLEGPRRLYKGEPQPTPEEALLDLYQKVGGK